MKTCTRCRVTQPIDSFMWRSRAAGRRDDWCRTCRSEYHHDHYLRNKARYIEHAARRARRASVERAVFFVAYFEAHPCVDCGETDPVVLEFDHLRDKEFTIGQIVGDSSWPRLVAEIAKCQVVCRNCHGRRTKQRANTARYRAAIGRLAQSNESG